MKFDEKNRFDKNTTNYTQDVSVYASKSNFNHVAIGARIAQLVVC